MEARQDGLKSVQGFSKLLASFLPTLSEDRGSGNVSGNQTLKQWLGSGLAQGEKERGGMNHVMGFRTCMRLNLPTAERGFFFFFKDARSASASSAYASLTVWRGVA